MNSYAQPQQNIPRAERINLDHLFERKRLAPQQLLVHDIRLEQRQPDAEPRLEVHERSAADLVQPASVGRSSSRWIRASEAGRNPIEQQRLTDLEEEYGWMSSLRIKQLQHHVHDPQDTAKIRWMYVADFFYVLGHSPRQLERLSDHHVGCLRLYFNCSNMPSSRESSKCAALKQQD